MLIIAQPKSASTSLAKTLAKILKLECTLGIPRLKIEPDCEGFTEIQKFHDNMIERTPIFFRQSIQNRKKIVKEHILPTKRHIGILKLIFKRFPMSRVLVVLRNPEDSIDCYVRGKYKIKSKSKLTDDLNIFYEEYIKHFANKNYKNVLIIFYKDLILNYKETIQKIIDFWGFNYKKPKIIPLLKLRYTGIGEKRILEQKDVDNMSAEDSVDKSRSDDSMDSKDKIETGNRESEDQ